MKKRTEKKKQDILMIIIVIYNPHENENEILMTRIPNHITNRETKRNQIMMIIKKKFKWKKGSRKNNKTRV